MKNGKKFADQVSSGDFLVTAEYMPPAAADSAHIDSVVDSLKQVPSAVNVSDNPFGVGMSGFAASLHLSKAGIEPVFQMVTRDRNRIALQSDILGAASMGINNILCLSGYHQTLTDSPQSANVYDIDSTQLIAIARSITEKGELQNGAAVSGRASLITGAVANPYLKPVELNMIRLSQKVEAGATFIQTHAVFDTDGFTMWLNAAKGSGVTEKAAILAGIIPLESAEEAESLKSRFTDFYIPDTIIERLKDAGDSAAQRREGIKICVEIINSIKNFNGLRGIHLMTGGKEDMIPEILSSSGLTGK